jgi:hypothetical protein
MFWAVACPVFMDAIAIQTNVELPSGLLLDPILVLKYL